MNALSVIYIRCLVATTLFFALPLMVILTLNSCGSPQYEASAEDSVDTRSQHVAEKLRTPVALIVESSHSGPFYGAKINTPTALRYSPDGSVFLIDRGNHRLLQFDRAMRPIGEIGASGAFRDFFDDLSAIAVGESYLYVCDIGRDRIHRLDFQLHAVDALDFEDDDDAFRFGEPAGLAVTVDDDIWVVDVSQRRIAVFDRNFVFREFLADYNSGGYSFRRPGAALGISDNRVVVCDSELGELALYDDQGFELGMIGKNILRAPIDITQSEYGHLWVADSLLDEILCFSPAGELLFRSSQSGTAFAALNPSGVCALGGDTLLVSDSGSGQILICRIYYSDYSD